MHTTEEITLVVIIIHKQIQSMIPRLHNINKLHGNKI